MHIALSTKYVLARKGRNRKVAFEIHNGQINPAQIR
jgi:hypothetical protein